MSQSLSWLWAIISAAVGHIMTFVYNRRGSPSAALILVILVSEREHTVYDARTLENPFYISHLANFLKGVDPDAETDTDPDVSTHSTWYVPVYNIP